MSDSTSVRSANVDTMRRLLEENPEGLTADQAAEFDSAENRVRHFDDMAQRTAAVDAGMAKFAGVIGDRDIEGQVTEAERPQERAIGNLPPVSFADEELRRAFSELGQNRPSR